MPSKKVNRVKGKYLKCINYEDEDEVATKKKKSEPKKKKATKETRKKGIKKKAIKKKESKGTVVKKNKCNSKKTCKDVKVIRLVNKKKIFIKKIFSFKVVPFIYYASAKFNLTTFFPQKPCFFIKSKEFIFPRYNLTKFSCCSLKFF